MIVFSSACTDLELANPNQATEASFWKTEQDLYQGVIATYDQLQSDAMYALDMRVFLTLLADEGTNEAPWEFNDLARFNFLNLNQFANLWGGNYELIGRAYQVIDRAPEISGSGVPQLTAEAQFMVALAYYNLVTGFGERIAYVDQLQNAADRPSRAEPGELWSLAETMLITAIPNLPIADQLSSGDYGRVTKGAAQVLLAKIHMQQQDFAAAEPLLLNVIESGQYELLEDFEDNFVELNFENPEALFVVNFIHDGPESETDRTLWFKFSSVGEAQGAYGDVQSQNVVRREFLLEPDADGELDPRMDVTLFWEGTGRLHFGQTHNWWVENAELFNPDVNTAFQKYTEQEAVGNNDPPNQAVPPNGGTDFILIRYADVLLSYAEVLNELGRTSEAYAFVDEVRVRSNMEALADTQPGMGQSEFLAQLKHERLLELAGEAVRWFDLIRWGDYGPVSSSNDPNFDTFVVGKTELFPIPQAELDLNDQLVQNPGY